MRQRTAIMIAAALTAFVLVIVGGLASRLTQVAGLASAPTAVVVAPTALPPAVDPTVEALMREREAAYQAALAEANARLEAANAQIAQANGQVIQAAAGQQQLQEQLAQALDPTAVPAPATQAPAPTQAPAAPAPPTYAITPEQAQTIALGAAPSTVVAAEPELVSYEGTPAYEVRLDRGLVYIDAQTGAVLHNGAAAPAPPAQPATISREQAIQAAVAYRGGGEVVDVELDQEHGRQVYEVKFRDGSKVYVDAVSGQVVYAKINNGEGAGDHDDEGGEGHDEGDDGHDEGDD